MDAFIGEIRMMGFPFAPKGWALCQGQLLSVQQNQALYSLLGTTYGGNGVQTFGLPDLRGRVGIGQGQGPGLSPYAMGQQAGQASVALLTTNLPAHSHAYTGTVKAADDRAASPDPANGQYPATGPATQYSTGTPNGSLGGAAISGTTGNQGSSQPHENRQPGLTMNYCICTSGYFPSRQ